MKNKLMEEQAQNILPRTWEGSISYKKGIIVKKAYAVVNQMGITIRQSDDIESVVLHKISYSQVKQFTPPMHDFMTFFLKGYTGFKIEYEDEGNVNSIAFWARGMLPAYPDSTENPKLGSALSLNMGKSEEEVGEMTKSLKGDSNYVIYIVSLIVGFIFSGVIGMILMAIAAHSCVLIGKRDFSMTAKYLLYAGIYGVAIFTMIIIQTILIAALY